DRRAEVVPEEPLIQSPVVAGRVAEDLGVDRAALVPEPRAHSALEALLDERADLRELPGLRRVLAPRLDIWGSGSPVRALPPQPPPGRRPPAAPAPARRDRPPRPGAACRCRARGPASSAPRRSRTRPRRSGRAPRAGAGRRPRWTSPRRRPPRSTRAA